MSQPSTESDGAQPLRRTDALIVRRVGDETVVYDRDSERVTALDPGTTAVWEACDGRADIGDISVLAGVGREHAETSLLQLADAGLLAGGGMSRRNLLRAGVAGTAVPLLSIAAADAAFAASAGQVSISSAACSTGNKVTLTLSLTHAAPNSSPGYTWKLFDGATADTSGTIAVPASGSASTTVVSGNLGKGSHTVTVRVYHSGSTGSYSVSNALTVTC